jgi:hypothetical protein
MNLNILKSNYRFREEIIFKLSEFLLNIYKLQLNFQISNKLLETIQFILMKEPKIKKKEDQFL